jgi:hypothetical protein
MRNDNISIYNSRVSHYLFIHLKKACDSVRREVLYNILNEFCIPVKLVRLIKIYLNETYGKVRVDKHLKKNDVGGGAYSMYVGEEKCIPGFDGEASGKETTCKTYT